MNDIESIKDKFFKNVSWLFGGKTAAGVIGAVETVVVARLLGVSEYGLLVLVIAYVDILNMLIDVRVWETATKYIGSFWASGEKQKARSTIKLSYIIDVSTGALAFVIVIATANLAGEYFLKSEEAYVLVSIYAISLLIDTANTTSKAIHRVFDKFKQIAFVSTFRNTFKLILVSIVLFLGMGIKGVLYAYVVTSFAEFALWLFLVSGILEENDLKGWWSSNTGLVKDKWKEMAWFLGNTSFTSTLKMAGDKYIGILILGYFAGKDSAAYYKIARSILDMLNRLADPLRDVIFPEMVRMLTLDALEDFKEIVKYSTKNLMKFIVPLAILILLITDPILSLVFGEKYLPASNATRLLVVASVISQLVFWVSPALLAFGRSGLRTVLGIISIGSYLILLVIFAPLYAHTGAALAYLGYSGVKASISMAGLRVSMKGKREEMESKDIKGAELEG